MRRRVLALLVLSGCFTTIAGSGARAQAGSGAGGREAVDALPRAPGAAITTVTPSPGFFTEPSIAVDPRDPRRVVAAYQDNAHAAWSIDGGATWTLADSTTTAPPDYRVSGDVSVTFDRQGHAFLCYMAFDRLGTEGYWAHGATRGGIFVRRSLDGGRTWARDHVALAEHPSEPGVPWEDKPYILADNTNGRYAGNLYVGWTRFLVDRTLVLFTRSTDDGATWSRPIVISSTPGLPRDDNGAVEGFSGAVGPDGTVYAVWADGNGIAFTSSRDGGRTFGRSRTVIRTGPLYYGIASFTRGNGFPVIAVDPGHTGGEDAHHERLFVTWSDYTNGDFDVFVATSVDRGQHWSPPVRVNTDPLHDGRDQFFTWLAVDPSDGSAYALFYDRRGDSANVRPTVTLARSSDGGQSWRNFAWSTDPFDPHRAGFLGDYSGIAALGGRVYGIWTEEASSAPPSAGAGPSGARARANTIVRIGVAEFSR